MAYVCLTKTIRKKYFKELKLGEYNEANILKMQKGYFPHYSYEDGSKKNNWDGKYGKDSDRLLRHLYNVHKYCKNFTPEEFKCECGGKYCTGYPTRMRANALKNIQAFRDHCGVPTTITSALRCKKQNAIDGGITNSKHLSGKAADMANSKTKTLKGRKELINWLKKLPNHSYSYCNGYNSLGEFVDWKGMSTSIHTDVR